jgi:hypothetical protein
MGVPLLLNFLQLWETKLASHADKSEWRINDFFLENLDSGVCLRWKYRGTRQREIAATAL